MRYALWIVPLLAIATVATAASSDVVRSRIAGYRALGIAFKTANDTIRSRNFGSARLKQAAAEIVASSRSQYRWYPAGSGPGAGEKTAAKREIWTRSEEFRAAQGGFARQAQVFERAVKGGDDAAIRLEARKLGAQCKGCHDRFRLSDD